MDKIYREVKQVSVEGNFKKQQSKATKKMYAKIKGYSRAEVYDADIIAAIMRNLSTWCRGNFLAANQVDEHARWVASRGTFANSCSNTNVNQAFFACRNRLETSVQKTSLG